MGIINKISISEDEVTTLVGFESAVVGNGNVVANLCKIFPNYGVCLYQKAGTLEKLVCTIKGKVTRVNHIEIGDAISHYTVEFTDISGLSVHSIRLKISSAKKSLNLKPGDVVIRTDICSLESSGVTVNDDQAVLFFLVNLNESEATLGELQKNEWEDTLGWEIMSISGDMLVIKKNEKETFISCEDVSLYEEIKEAAIFLSRKR